jgi:hypothetical protein
MAEKPQQPPAPQQLNLKDPVLAGFLAWLLPGLGHFYQGRYAKGALYLVCILGTFSYGLYLSSSQDSGPARAVYFSFRDGDWRLAYLCQVGVGLPALPALAQAVRVSDGKEPLWKGFMAPPYLEPINADKRAPQPDKPALRTLSELHRDMHHYFEFGMVYTMIAGLLNILAVYDACCGPAEGPAEETEDEEAAEKEGDDGQ